jgi:hypothetical protein
MRRNLKKELIAIVRINNDFVTYIANACGKGSYALTHVIIFRCDRIYKDDDNGGGDEHDYGDTSDD